MFTIIFALLTFGFMDKEVGKEIKNLGAQKFAIREKASDNLVKMGERALFQLRFATYSKDPEIVMRAKRIIEAYCQVKPTNYSYVPFFDMLPMNYPNREKIYTHYLHLAYQITGYQYHGQGTPYAQRYPAFRIATSLYVKDMMEQGKWTKKQAIKFLDSLVPTEKVYLKKLEDNEKHMPPARD